MPGRTVKLFLVDGAPQGLRTAEIPFGWTGKVIVSPRADLPTLANREEVMRTGIYFLVGPGNSPSNLSVYVGEADVVWTRISRHTKDEYADFWEQVVVFVNSNDHLTKAHVRWLEAELVRRIRNAKRAELKNRTDPVGGGLPEAERADMVSFLENVQFLMPIIGMDIFRPEVSSPQLERSSPQSELVLELHWDTANAKCLVRDGKFVIQKGSTARTVEVDSLGDATRRMRAELVKSGVLDKTPAANAYLFTEDFAFDTSSAAASVVSGTGLNGRRHWMVAGTKTSYGQWEDGQLKGTEVDADA